MFDKKAEVNPVEMIAVILVASLVVIMYVLILFQANDLQIDEKKIKAQLVVSRILNSNCFSSDFATIKESEFTQENLNECLKGNEGIWMRMYLSDIEFKTNGNALYLNNNKDDFLLKTNLCSTNTRSILCNDLKYPVVYLNEQNKPETRILSMQIISS